MKFSAIHIFSSILLISLSNYPVMASQCGDIFDENSKTIDSNNSKPESIRQVVEKYYLNIDNQKLDDVVSIFSKKSVYVRGSLFQLKSNSAIKNFFFNVRTLIGTHKIESYRETDNQVFVTGHFSGHSLNERVELDFTDIWIFNDNQKVIYRESWTEIDGI